MKKKFVRCLIRSVAVLFLFLWTAVTFAKSDSSMAPRYSLIWVKAGKTFAKVRSGSEYILLEDGSIGYWGSEGECGRIADSLNDFFELMINCPYWSDYLCEEEYQDREELSEFAKEIFKKHEENAQEDEFDLREAQQELADSLGIEIKADVAEILMCFYHCAKRTDRFIQTYTENDGSTHSGTGSLFDR